MAGIEQEEESVSGRTSAARNSVSVLACFPCKRRKVKCNRALPICSLCIKTGETCAYPTHPEKPGPKLGTTHKHRRRRSSRQATSSALDSPAASGDRSATRFTTTSSSENRKSASLDEGQRGHASGRLVTPSSPAWSPGQSSLRSQDSAGHASAPTFSQIMYPSHDVQTRPQSPSTLESPSEQVHVPSKVTVQAVCNALRVSVSSYKLLVEAYFTHMTSFSLFKPGSIDGKLATAQNPAEAEALVAAMFSFSSRFAEDYGHSSYQNEVPGGAEFECIASLRLEQALYDYGDSMPSLCILQAYILIAWSQLYRGVRSRSWRTLGNCVRLAYDMNLHLVDANHDRESNSDAHVIDLKRWSLLEERRRAWWAIWEMDVLASTIRRLPTAIDWTQNLTLLPVHDNFWFNNVYQESCFLAHDPSLRWKQLSRSGNNSPRAWFIVVNSLMRNTQLIVYTPRPSTPPDTNVIDTIPPDLNIMANSLYCTTTSLPPELVYHGETLDFRTKAFPRDITIRQYHSDKYGIHLMTQLCRFMIHHQKICSRAPWLNKASHDGSPHQTGASISDWSNYISAADEITTVVRNSPTDHYKYVNPFLINTLWFAAATQCACKVFGPPPFDKRHADSNLDLLRLVIDRFMSFWDISDTLKSKLERIETGLKSLMARESATNAQYHTREGERQNDVGDSRNSATLSAPRQQGHAQGTGFDAPIPGLPMAALAASNMPPFAPGVDVFNQPFLTDDPAWRGWLTDPVEFFPFGLQELLMYNAIPHA